MTLTLPDEVIQAARLTEAELQAAMAIALFQGDRLTLSQAARLAGLPHLEFQRLLASQQIPVHYGMEEMEEDLRGADLRTARWADGLSYA